LGWQIKKPKQTAMGLKAFWLSYWMQIVSLACDCRKIIKTKKTK